MAWYPPLPSSATPRSISFTYSGNIVPGQLIEIYTTYTGDGTKIDGIYQVLSVNTEEGHAVISIKNTELNRHEFYKFNYHHHGNTFEVNTRFDGRPVVVTQYGNVRLTNLEIQEPEFIIADHNGDILFQIRDHQLFISSKLQIITDKREELTSTEFVNKVNDQIFPKNDHLTIED